MGALLSRQVCASSISASASTLTLRLRGEGAVRVSLQLDAPGAEPVAAGEGQLHGDWEALRLDCTKVRGVHAAYLRFEAQERLQLEELIFEE